MLGRPAPSVFYRLIALFGAVLVALITSPRSASAQHPSLDARTWRPSTDPNASLVIEPAITPGPGVFTLGAYGHFSHRPIVLRRAGTDDVAFRPLDYVLGVDAIANLGIGNRFAVGAIVPVILHQDGDGNLPPTISNVPRTPNTGFGDLGVTLKGSLIRNEQGGFGLAALGLVSIPTGDRASFSGEGSPTVSARLLAEYTLLVAVAQASIGYKLRTDHHTWPDASVGGFRFGDEIPWTMGIAMRPGILGIDPGNRQRLEIGVHGWLPAGPVGPFGTGDPGSAALSPVMLALSDRVEMGHYKDVFVTLGGELGLTEAVGVPTFRAIVGIGWTPRSHDLDGDGVKDDVDGCPEIPEDRDGFEDADGCPEIDNDDDGIIDKEDACRNVKGSPSSDPKRNGCPMQDMDGDGVEDDKDACPKDKGLPSQDPKRHGCPQSDGDQDGIDDSLDKCPTQAEDKDGYQDEDGCPDPDNDGDGIQDKDDACPNVAGEPSTDPAKNGCANPDRDGDTFENEIDKCPDSAEVFNGVDDDDGCPDEGGKPLVTIDGQKNVRVDKPIKLIKSQNVDDVDPASMPTLRALALELNRHRDWTLAIGTRPEPTGDQDAAQLASLARSFAVVRVLSSLSRRDGVAETVGWDAVKNKPQAETGIAFMILVTPMPGTPSKTPPTPPGPPPPLPKAGAPGEGPTKPEAPRPDPKQPAPIPTPTPVSPTVPPKPDAGAAKP